MIKLIKVAIVYKIFFQAIYLELEVDVLEIDIY